MAVISHAQFAGMEGGSRRLSDMTEGPKSGYYVARDPNTPVERGGSDEVTEQGVGSEADVKAHYDSAVAKGAMHAIPGNNPREVYQGKWKEYLDVSDRYTASTRGLMHALQHGMANVQLSAWAAHNPVVGEEYGPGDKRDVQITGENKETGEKTGHPLGVRMVANALHAQEARRARNRGA
jgi:hypothetical protein